MRSLTAALLVLLSTSTFGAIPGDRQTDAGIPMGYQNNPYTYVVGNVQSVAFPEQGDTVITNLTFHPLGTYMLFTQQVSLCGNQEGQLNFRKSDTVMIVMTNRLTRRYCHDLLRIDVIQESRPGSGKQSEGNLP